MEQMILLAAIAALLLVAVILLIVLLVRQGRGDRRAHGELRQLGHALMNELSAQRDESLGELRASGDSLSGMLGHIGQSQQALLESTQRQVVLSARGQDERLHQLDLRMDALRQSTQSALNDLRQNNDRQLTEMRKTVDEKLTETLNQRLNDSFAQVSQRLEQVYKGLGEMQTLAAGVGDLKKVLSNVKTRGIWGEMQLGALMSQMLSPAQYEENVAVVPGASERVEFAVRLPGKGDAVIYLPIDSKFPQESYLRLTEASQSGDALATDTARKALSAAIRTEAKRIAAKYVAPPHTTDFAVMFLPIEALYAEVMRDVPLVEQIQREQRVVIAGPSTFAALLNALQMGFRTLAIEQRTGEVWQLLSAVRKDFSVFAETLEKTQLRLRQASESIDAAFVRTRSIEKKLGAVEEDNRLL